MKVLIGVDGSYDGDEAFDFYARHYHTPEQEALVVYVVKPLVISSNEMAIHVNDMRDRSLNEEKMKVKFLKESYEEKMRSTRIRGKINIIYYCKKPGKIICELAEQEHCAMIVIGCIRNGKGNLGPTVDYVIRKASCAVSLVRMGSSLPGSPTTKLHELYTAGGHSGTAKDANPPLRRISCPAMDGPPVVPVEGEAIVRGGSVTAFGSADGKTVLPGAASKQPTERRHSTITNAFRFLGFQQSGRRKLIPSHEEDEENNDNNL